MANPETATESILCLGSNTADGAELIERACEMLSEHCEILRQTGHYPSGSGYLNKVMVVTTKLPVAELIIVCKTIERSLGRTPQMKEQGIVPVDIDVVVYDGEVIRPRDYTSSYFITGLAMMG